MEAKPQSSIDSETAFQKGNSTIHNLLGGSHWFDGRFCGFPGLRAAVRKLLSNPKRENGKLAKGAQVTQYQGHG